MNDFLTIIIATIILISLFIHYESKYSDLTYIISKVDDNEYMVRNRIDKEQAADLLATIKQNLINIVKICETEYANEERVVRLVQKFKPQKISESPFSSKHTSYSINKGEKIVFCIRSKDKDEKLIKLNTMMFVAIHELAHVMTKSIGHTEEFWDNMRFLLRVAIKNKIYKSQNFKKKPIAYCGTKITDTPLKD
jgi:predicted metal-dependent hydrolase